MKCAVEKCNQDNLKNKDRLTFYKFPRDVNVAKKWKLFCGNSKQEYSHICSLHFKPDDILGEVKFKRGKKRKLLKLGAVPCIKTPETELPRSKRSINNMSEESNSVKLSNGNIEEMDMDENKNDTLLQEAAQNKTIKTQSQLSLDIECFESVLDELNNQIETLHSKNIELKIEKKIYKSEVLKLEMRLDKSYFNISQLEYYLGKTCSKEQMSQIKSIINKRWTEMISDDKSDKSE